MKKIIYITILSFFFIFIPKEKVFADQIPQVSNSLPLVGAYYSHYQFPNCWVAQGYILADYQKPGVRDIVKQHLSLMKQDGIQSIRFNVWFEHNPAANPDPSFKWTIPSATGQITEPYRTNLINFLTDIKTAGFENLMVSIPPMGENRLGGVSGVGTSDEAVHFEETWSFMQNIHDLVKQFGPQNVKFDIGPEGAVQDDDEWKNRAMVRETELWRRYVQKYGNSDATMSFIAGYTPDDLIKGNQLQNILSVFRSSGAGFPTWFQFSLYPDTVKYKNSKDIEDIAYAALQKIDQILMDNNLSQPLGIAETLYNNQSIANAIDRFRQNSERKLIFINEWPIEAGAACAWTNPPYTAKKYIDTLQTLNVNIVTPSTINKSGKYTLNTDNNYNGYLEVKYSIYQTGNTTPIVGQEKWCYDQNNCLLVQNGSATVNYANRPFPYAARLVMQFRSWGSNGPWSNSVELTITDKVTIDTIRQFLQNFTNIFDYNTLISNFGK